MEYSKKMLGKMSRCRHVIHSFLNCCQNYIYYRVIEKETQRLMKKLHSCSLDAVPELHLQMLDAILIYGLIDSRLKHRA